MEESSPVVGSSRRYSLFGPTRISPGAQHKPNRHHNTSNTSLILHKAAW